MGIGEGDPVNEEAWRRRIGYFGTQAEWEAFIAGGGGGGAVASVNGSTGIVVLDAADVGAATPTEVDADVAAHNADTTDVHGITNTVTLVHREDLPYVLVDDYADIPAAITAVAAGGTMKFSEGIYSPDDRLVLTKAFTMEAAGGWATWLAAPAGLEEALIEWNLPDTPPSGIVHAYYGAKMSGIGLYLYDAPDCTGILVGHDTSWFEADDIVVQGGDISIDNHGVNGTWRRTKLFDARIMWKLDGDRTEMNILDSVCARNLPGETEWFIDITATDTPPIKGQLCMSNVRCNSNSGGDAFTSGGMRMTGPSGGIDLPLWARGVQIDNVTGGGPALELIDINDIHFTDGWLNAGNFGPAVRIAGGARIWLGGNDLFGGPVGDPSTVEFVDGGYSTNGVFLSKNRVPSQPFYKLPAANKPTNLYIDDVSSEALVTITNDPIGLAAALGREVVKKPKRIVSANDPTYTLDYRDAGETVYASNAAGCVVTIPNAATVPIPAGAEFNITNGTGGTLSFGGPSGGTLLIAAPFTAAARAVGSQVTLQCILPAINLWTLTGDLAT